MRPVPHGELLKTVNGRAAAVVQDAEASQQLLDIAARADAAEGVRQGLEDVAKHNVLRSLTVSMRDHLRCMFTHRRAWVRPDEEAVGKWNRMTNSVPSFSG